jgi:subtilase family serine protease
VRVCSLGVLGGIPPTANWSLRRLAVGIAIVALTAAGCAAGSKPGHAAPVNTTRGNRGTNGTKKANVPDVGLTPQQVRRAYNVGPLLAKGIDGKGQTIVIVDSFGSPTIVRDLAAFDAAFGLPAPPSLKVIQPAGPVPGYRPTSNRVGWASETTLDVEWAHAMAPGASILLVETPTSENEGITGFPQIVQAEKYVLEHHLGQVISQSFGATEQTFTSAAQLRSMRSAYQLADKDKVTVLAASGDSGAAGETFNMKSYFKTRAIEWPASDPLVTAVGGTKLSLTASGTRTAPDVAWNDGGGGRSDVFGRPGYQDGVRGLTGNHRGIPDISMDASCASGVAIRVSYPGSGSRWQGICGTSLATPLFAGIVAMAYQDAHGHKLGLINGALYKMTAADGLVDVTKGNNTFSFSRRDKTIVVPGFSARPGYDLASGLGTVNAALFVPALARLAG